MGHSFTGSFGLLLTLTSLSCEVSKKTDADNRPPPRFFDKGASSQGRATSAATENWERMRQCADQADRLAARLKWNGSTGDVGWGNHYNAVSQRCFVIYTQFDSKKMTVFEELYDGFEGVYLGNRLIESIGNKDVICTATPHPWTESLHGVDCAEYRKFLQDRMEN